MTQPATPTSITITLDGMKTSTPGNNCQHWRKDWQASKVQRARARGAISSLRALPALPVIVTLTRLSPRNRMDRHNLPGAMKHVIDGIADAYGVDDGDPRWEFRFEQEKAAVIGVRIRIERAKKDGVIS